jgi:uncharacterized membrane protein
MWTSIVFSNRDAAMAATSAVRESEAKGFRIDTLHLIDRGQDGAMLEERADDDFPPPSGTFAGLILGGIIGGLFRWPLGAAVGAAVGAAIGLLRDWYEWESYRDFAAQIGSALLPGAYAVILESRHEVPAMLDLEMTQLGGIVTRMSKSAAIRAYRSGEARKLRAALDTGAADGLQALRTRVKRLGASPRQRHSRL